MPNKAKPFLESQDPVSGHDDGRQSDRDQLDIYRIVAESSGSFLSVWRLAVKLHASQDAEEAGSAHDHSHPLNTKHRKVPADVQAAAILSAFTHGAAEGRSGLNHTGEEAFGLISNTGYTRQRR